MTLFQELNRFVDVTADRLRADPDASRTHPPTLFGPENLLAFQRAITEASPSGDVPGATLYVPPGRYLIAPDLELLHNIWFDNIAVGYRSDESMRTALTAQDQARRNNPFGASVRFPEGTSLWLAPGAVLVPAAGCIVEISSLLVCERTECFDLSQGGLVVFGRQVPVLRPEWWGAVHSVKTRPWRKDIANDEIDGIEIDASDAIQSAIDAAIGSRSIRWPTVGEWICTERDPRLSPDCHPPLYVFRLPPLQVELSGYYFVDRTLNVNAEVATSEVLQRLHPYSVLAGASVTPPDTTTIVRGAWAGRQGQGATLIAGRSLGENPILRLTRTGGLSIKNLAFSTRSPTYQPCVEVWATSADNRATETAHGIAFYSCDFSGFNTPLVQVGARAEIVAPPPGHTLPIVLKNGQFESDFSLLSFEACDFFVLGTYAEGVAVDMRANETFSTRFRGCDFRGYAAAMLSLWSGGHYLEGCRFENRRRPDITVDPDRSPYLRGLELPDNSDVFLRLEYPTLPAGSTLLAVPNFNLLPAFTALGCVSRSHRFLSTVSPNPYEVAQGQEWPVVLLNLRHRVSGERASSSVRWGMTHHVRSAIVLEGGAERRMGRSGPLVVLGGSFASEILVLRGAVHAAVVGARVHDAAGALVSPTYRIDPGDIRRPFNPTTIFGLRVDQPASIRAFYGS